MSVTTRTAKSTFRNDKKHERAETSLNARDARKKKAKQAIDNPHSSKLKRRNDPGVPNLSSVISRLQQQHDNNKHVKRQIVNEKKHHERMEKRKQLSIPLTTEQSLMRAVASSDQQYEPFEMEESGKDIDVAKRRWYWAEMKKVVEAADIILEILDARDPLGCRCPSVERLILSKLTVDGAQNKRIILVLNKIDLVPMENAAAWVKHLRREFPCIAFKSNTQHQRSNMSHATAKASQVDVATLSRSNCVGGDELRQLLKNYSRSCNMKKQITVGIIGYPNVGKSSIINSLKRSRAVGVGSTPGLTKTLQEVKLDKQISLIDSPGVMFSAGDDQDEEGLLLRNCLRVEQLSDPTKAVYGIVKRCTASTLQQVYDIPPFRDADEFIFCVANKRKKMLKGGILDLIATARLIVQDWNDGTIPFHTQPPTSEGVISSDVVSSWAREFNVEALLSPSIEHVDDDDDGMEDEEKQNITEDDEKYVLDIVPKPMDAPQMDDDSTSDERLLAAADAIQHQSTSTSTTTSTPTSRVLTSDQQRNKTLKQQQKNDKLQQRRMSHVAPTSTTMLMDS